MFIVFYATNVDAQNFNCDDRGKVLRHFEKSYSEVPVAFGLANNSVVLEVLSSREGETWTIIVTSPQGISCLMASGTDWEMMFPPDLNKPDGDI